MQFFQYFNRVDTMQYAVMIKGNLYKQGKVTLREASGLLKLSQIETMNLSFDAGIKGNLDASDVLASLERFVSKQIHRYFSM